MDGVKIIRSGEFIHEARQEAVHLGILGEINHVDISLMTIQEGRTTLLVPAKDKDVVEFMYILEGQFAMTEEDIILSKGDSILVKNVKKTEYFKAITEVKVLYLSHESIIEEMSETIEKLNEIMIKVNDKDQYTRDHCNRVCEWIPQVTKRMNLSHEVVTRLVAAALFHDIGKIDIDTDILHKVGKLTDEEFEKIKLHPQAGKEILTTYGFIEQSKIVAQHHERIDGSGYPLGLKGDQISIEAKIIAVIDSYDAMISDRPYRAGMTKEAAIDELVRCKGSWYDSEIVDIFIDTINDECSD